MVASDKVDRTIDDITNPEAHNLSMQMNNSSPQITTTTIPLPAAMAYLSRTLAATLAFKHELAFNSRHAQENTYPPLAIIYGTSVPTVYGARDSRLKRGHKAWMYAMRERNDRELLIQEE